jgi:hypothetical protein
LERPDPLVLRSEAVDDFGGLVVEPLSTTRISISRSVCVIADAMAASSVSAAL